MSNDKVWEDPNGDIRADFSGQAKAAKNIGNKAGLTTYSDIDLASGYHKDLIWVTKDGRRIAIPNMSDNHLLNTIAFLRRRVDNYKKQLAMSMLNNMSMAINMFDDIAEEWIETAYARFKETAKEVFDMPDEQFLVKYLPKYQKLYQEAYRRKILIEVDSRKIAGHAIHKDVSQEDDIVDLVANADPDRRTKP